MKKNLSILMLLVAIVTGAWAATTDPGYAGSSYLNLSNYSSIDDAGHNVSNLTHMYDYKSADKVLRVSAYGSVTAVSTQKWVTGSIGNTSRTWEATDNFAGSSAYMTNSSKCAQLSSGKSATYKVTNCTKIEALLKTGGSSRTIYLKVYEQNSDGTDKETPVLVKDLSWKGSNAVHTLSADELDEGKVYKAVVTNDATGNSDFYEMAFYLPTTPATTYSVEYNLNGATGTTPEETNKAEGAQFTLHDGTTDITAPEGKVFDGWNDGTTTYAGGAQYTMPGDNVTFTAQWRNEAAKHSVEYKLNGGSGDAPTQADVEEEQNFIVASAEGITAPEGKVFKCWNDGTNDYNPGAEYTMGTSDVTLTAQWLTINDASFSDGQYAIGGSALDLSTLFTSSSDGAVTYSVKSAGDTGAAIDGTSFTATAAGTATVTATQAATATYAGASLDATITVGGTTGANTITYTLDVTSEADDKKTDINSTNVSSSLYVSSLVGITNNTGASYGAGGSKANLTVKIPTQATYDENKYMSVGFSVNSGYVFVPSSISVKAQPVSTNKSVKLVLTDGTNSIEKTVDDVAQGAIATVTLSNEDKEAFSGNVTLKIYCYGDANTYRLGSPISIAGAVLPEPKEITIGNGGFSTFAGEYNYTVSGAKALAAQNKSTSVGFTEIPSETVIPANTGVVLQGTEGDKATITYTTEDAGTVTTDMVGVTAANPFVASSNVYVIATKTAGTKFYKYTGSTFPLGKAYLNAGANVDALDIDFGGATAVEAIAEANANSVAPVKVIKNGKLYIGNYNVAGQQVK